MFYLSVQFIQNYGANICNQSNDMEWIPVKFLILSLSLVHELQIMHERAAEYGIEVQRRSEFSSPKTPFLLNYGEVAILFEKFAEIFLLILVLETDCTSLFKVSTSYRCLELMVL